MIWHQKHPHFTAQGLGYLPWIIREDDPRPAKAQIEERYIGGWLPLPGLKVTDKGLEYPGDPPQRLLAEAELRHETLRFYESEWLAIIQPDGSYEVSRMD
jgi:hypothetical protein